jgi:hypothetical protein
MFRARRDVCGVTGRAAHVGMFAAWLDAQCTTGSLRRQWMRYGHGHHTIMGMEKNDTAAAECSRYDQMYGARRDV